MTVLATKTSAGQGGDSRIGRNTNVIRRAAWRGAIGLAGRMRIMALMVACALIAAIAQPATAARHKNASGSLTARPHGAAHRATAVQQKQKAVSRTKVRRSRAAAHRRAPPSAPTTAPAPALPGDLGRAKDAIGLIQRHKLADAAAAAKAIDDTVIRKLVEWTLLRSGHPAIGFERYVAFISANPQWPGRALLRRRAEARLWQERRDAATVRAFLAGGPTSAKGRLALARALAVAGDLASAEREVRTVWRAEALSAELEAAVLEGFPAVLGRDDHAIRMGRRIGARDFGAAMRAARRIGDDAVAIVKACSAISAKSDEAGQLLDDVPTAARGDLGYTLCRVQHLVRKSDVAGAARVLLAADQDNMAAQDTDEWWRARRTLARKLLDAGAAPTAYRVVSGAASPANRYYRAEFHFMAGWIALRFLADPTTALAHFAHVDDGSANPVVLARAAYWRGRAHEAAEHADEARAEYAAAARHATAYYGQLARARLGLGETESLRSPPEPAQAEEAEVVRAAEVLYELRERDLALAFATSFAEQSDDEPVLAALAAIAVRNGDARATLLIGKAALSRGLALDLYAFPGIGVPHYAAVGPAIERSIVYSVARTESEFNQRDRSPANAVGLMQVTPEAGRDTARRFGVKYDWKQLVSDPVYNTQMGAAELAALLKEYRGSFIMSFAGYNAGRGRVRDWVANYGDPRDGKVDPVDWVERIPFAETRNYVQRVLENLHVYRARFRAEARAVREHAPTVAADDATGATPQLPAAVAR